MELHLVRRFRELGGTVVTLGSDAHTAGAVGGGIREGASIAAQAGFITDCRVPESETGIYTD